MNRFPHFFSNTQTVTNFRVLNHTAFIKPNGYHPKFFGNYNFYFVNVFPCTAQVVMISIITLHFFNQKDYEIMKK